MSTHSQAASERPVPKPGGRTTFGHLGEPQRPLSSDSDEPVAVTVARAALCEAGRPDLAEQVTPNRIGHPSRSGHRRWDYDDLRIVTRAFRLAHLADPRAAPVTCCHDNPLTVLWYPACEDCDRHPWPTRAEWENP